MKKDKKCDAYPPKDRTFYCPEKHDLESCSKTGKTCTKLPDPTTDPIVCNNIAYGEFDYTEDPLDDK